MNKLSSSTVQLLIVFIAVVLFFPLLGIVHLFDWDEINFAESAREMIVSGDYLNVQINFTAFWEKPPLFIWMQVLSMKLFGVNEFAARFPNAVCGIVTLLSLYSIGKKEFNHRFGIIWALTYLGSVLPFFYFKSGIIDPWFNYFIFLSIYYFHRYFTSEENRIKPLLLTALFNGLGILTKGPVAFLVFLLAFGVYLLIRRFKLKTSALHIIYFALALAFVGGFWFLLQIMSGNYTVIQDFIEYQIRLFSIEDAGHGGFLLYHFVVLFIGVFPASIFALPYLFGTGGDSPKFKDFRLWMVILFWVVLILFTIVNTKIVHYSSLCYFPLTFMGALGANAVVEKGRKPEKIVRVILPIIGVVYTLLVAGIVLFALNINWVIDNVEIADPFAVGNMQAQVNWSGFEMIVPIVLLLGFVFYYYFLRRQAYEKGILSLFAGNALFVGTLLAIIVPKIEGYSQRAALEFFQDQSKNDVYLTTLYYKSYAHYFYGEIDPYSNPKALDKTWLLHGEIDKPVYFSAKIHKKEQVLRNVQGAKFLYEKNGFVFFVRPNKRVIQNKTEFLNNSETIKQNDK